MLAAYADTALRAGLCSSTCRAVGYAYIYLSRWKQIFHALVCDEKTKMKLKQIELIRFLNFYLVLET